MELKEYFAPSKLNIFVFLSITIMFFIFLGAFSAPWYLFAILLIFSYYYACHIVHKVDNTKDPNSFKLLADFFWHYVLLFVVIILIHWFYVTYFG